MEDDLDLGGEAGAGDSMEAEPLEEEGEGGGWAENLEVWDDIFSWFSTDTFSISAWFWFSVLRVWGLGSKVWFLAI